MFRLDSNLPDNRFPLTAVLNKFSDYANSNGDLLWRMIPASEFWRFLIDGDRQANSRRIANYLEISLRQFSRENSNSESQVTADDKSQNIIRDQPIKLDDVRQMTLSEYAVEYESKSFYQSDIIKYLSEINHSLVDSLCASGQLQNMTIDELLTMDTAWLGFELREPGYLISAQQALHYALKLPADFDCSHIQTLHRIAGSLVENTNYDDSSEELKGQFRKFPAHGYGLVHDNATLDGLEELINEKDHHKRIIIRIHEPRIPSNSFEYEIQCGAKKPVTRMKYMNKFVPYINVDMHPDEGVEEIRNKMQKLMKMVGINNDISDEWVRLVFNVRENVAKLVAESAIPYSAKQSEDINKYDPLTLYLYHNVIKAELKEDLPYATLHYRYVTYDCAADVNVLINEYHRDIKIAKSPYEKIEVICQFIKAIEQVHPFYDMNCRTFCMCLLQGLLKQNQLPFTILKDPNVFDAYSLPELVYQVIRGMYRTFKLIEQGKVFKVETTSIVAKLNSFSIFKKDIAYFNQLVDAETKLRASNAIRPSSLFTGMSSFRPIG